MTNNCNFLNHKGSANQNNNVGEVVGKENPYTLLAVM
jgi:hypothetical protein